MEKKQRGPNYHEVFCWLTEKGVEDEYAYRIANLVCKALNKINEEIKEAQKAEEIEQTIAKIAQLEKQIADLKRK